jgi:hypothetical protein
MPCKAGGRTLYVEVLPLTGPTFGSPNSAAVHISNVAVRKLVVRCAIGRLRVVSTELPACIRAEAVLLDEFVLLLCRRLVLAPRMSFVGSLDGRAEGASAEQAGVRHLQRVSRIGPGVCRARTPWWAATNDNRPEEVAGSVR